jgi:hypothetical protein
MNIVLTTGNLRAPGTVDERRHIPLEPAESDDQELDPANHIGLTCAA